VLRKQIRPAFFGVRLLSHLHVTCASDSFSSHLRNASSRLRHNVMSRTLPSQDRPTSSSSSSPEQETTSKLDLHQLPDDRPVFACHKCSEVIVGSPSPMVYVDTRLKSRVGTAGRTGLQGVQWPVRTSLVYLPFRYLNPPTGIDVTRCSV